MISFIVSIVVLILGYILYGKFVEKVFGVNAARPTPAVANPDGIDYVELPWWKAFLIQFLNIAGLGPIFGAIMGIMFGQSAFLWIVFGTIFAGGVHDYLSGMLSIRRNGASLPEIVGQELGSGVKQFMRVFSLLLMILVGAVFVSGPAGLLANLTPNSLNMTFWVVVIFSYYVLATLLPIDKTDWQGVSGVWFCSTFHGGRDSCCDVYQPSSYPRTHRWIGKSASCTTPYFPHHVCVDCLWSHFGLSRYAVATDGSLYSERTLW